MYKLNKDVGVYYTRAIIQTGFEKNFCLISHCNQVSMGISVNARNRQPINHVYSQHNNWHQVLWFLDFLYSKYKTGSSPVLFLEQKANPLPALEGPSDSSSLDVWILTASTVSQGKKQQVKYMRGPSIQEYMAPPFRIFMIIDIHKIILCARQRTKSWAYIRFFNLYNNSDI